MTARPILAPALPLLLALGACGQTTQNADVCAGVECSAHGSCVVLGGAPYCDCEAGYHPVFLACQPNDPGDPCLGVTCSGNGDCRVAGGYPVCDCRAGYHPADESPLICVADALPDGGREDGGPDDGGEDAPCRAGQTPCGGECVDLTTDPRHCGACSRACAPGEVCNEGSCASTCTAPLVNCSGACVELQTDHDHCGTCETECADYEECVSGGCLCTPECTGRECGDDGCRGTCPPGCGAGWTCGDRGSCECAGATCGDACCAPGERCTGDGCCLPDCTGRTCGGDGCGGSCPPGCGVGWSCTPTGDCSCAGTECGDACCTRGQVCTPFGCCTPNCTGRTCGGDGCGGSCLPGCGEGFTCTALGACICEGTTCGSLCCPSGQVCYGGACCTPDCTGRTCGGDGCGGWCPPGCGAGFTCTPGGTCRCDGTTCGALCCPAGQSCVSGSCCDRLWRTAPFAATKLTDLAVDTDGTIFLNGIRGTEVYVAALDACGVLLRENTFGLSGTDAMAGAHLALGSSYMFVVGQYTQAGTDPGNGLWARVPKTSLVPSWVWGLQGHPEQTDEVWSAVLPGDGSVWMTGATAVTPGPPSVWGIKGTEGGAACGWNVLPGYSGGGHALLHSGGRVWLAGARGLEAFLTSYAATDCSAVEPCACEPTGTTSAWIDPGALATDARALVDLGGSIYVVGFSLVDDLAGVDFTGSVSRWNGATVDNGPLWNPSTIMDGFVGAAAGSGMIYVSGASSMTETGGSGVVGAVAPATLEVSWTRRPTDARYCRDVAVDAAGGLIALCADLAENATVSRCDPSAPECP